MKAMSGQPIILLNLLYLLQRLQKFQTLLVDAKLDTKASKKGNYISVTAIVNCKSSDDVLSVYDRVVKNRRNRFAIRR